MDPEKLRKDYESLLEEVSREDYLANSGQKDEVNIAAIYDKYPHLYERENLDAIEIALKDAEGDDLRRLKELRRLVSGMIATQDVKELEDELMNAEAKAEIELPWGTRPYRLSFVELVNEDDRDRRKVMSEAQLKVRDSMNPLRERRFRKYYEFYEGMGYSNYKDAMLDLTGLDLLGLNRTMQRFLEETEKTYEKWFGHYLEKKLGFSLDDVQYHDNGYFFRAQEFDGSFPADGLVRTVQGFMEGLGVDVYAGENVRFDLEKRPKKSPRAFCSAIVVPTEVILNIMPKGGYDDWRAFLHELGHALHFGYSDAALDFEAKYLGDNSVTEAYAMFLDHLVMDRNWLETFLGPVNTDELIRFMRLKQLYMVRRYAAKLDYELVLHNGTSLDGKDRVYVETLSAATRIPYPAVNYLDDVDMAFYCARYLRAWIFQAQMHDYMRRNYGDRWFSDRRAGETLLELFRLSQKHTADEIARRLGYSGVEIDSLLNDIKKTLD
jgi:hypothetical protein